MLSRRFLSISPLLVSRSTAVRTTPKFLRICFVRDVRTFAPNNDGPKAEEGGEKAEASGQKPNEFPKPPLTPDQMKRLRKMIVISFVGSTVLTLFIMSRVGPGSKLQGESVPFDVFVEKFLKAGEVKNIMYLAKDAKAVVTLHDGAVIEGRPYEKNTIIVNYGQVGAPPDQFQNEIRRVEEKLGIGGPEQVPVQIINAPSGFRILEFTIGAMILVWLFSQYGRLALRRMAEARKGAGGPPSPPKAQ